MRSSKVNFNLRTVYKMRRIWRAGASAFLLAERYRTTPGIIWRICEPGLFGPVEPMHPALPYGVKRGPTGRPRPKTARDALLLARWLEGVPGVELARRFGISKSTVSGIVKGHPRPVRYRGEPAAFTLAPAVATPPQAPAPPPPAGQFGPPDPRDAIRPQRQNYARRSKHGRAKLGELEVELLKALRASGETYPALARRFGISRSNVWYILSGTTWAPERGEGS